MVKQVNQIEEFDTISILFKGGNTIELPNVVLAPRYDLNQILLNQF